MGICSFMTPSRYSGSYIKFFCGVSVQEVLDCGIKVYWHENWYEDSKIRWRREEYEAQKWSLLRKESDLPEDGKERVVRENGKEVCLVSSVRIFYRATGEQFKRLLAVDAENKRRGEEYWRWYRESGQADRDAEARGRFWSNYLSGAGRAASEQYVYEHDIAPEAAI